MPPLLCHHQCSAMNISSNHGPENLRPMHDQQQDVVDVSSEALMSMIEHCAQVYMDNLQFPWFPIVELLAISSTISTST